MIAPLFWMHSGTEAELINLILGTPSEYRRNEKKYRGLGSCKSAIAISRENPL